MRGNVFNRSRAAHVVEDDNDLFFPLGQFLQRRSVKRMMDPFTDLIGGETRLIEAARIEIVHLPAVREGQFPLGILVP